jgi:uncharacterized Rossmann fold enzyme
VTTATLDPELRLDPTVKQPVSYCIPLWLRNLQIEQNIKRVAGRLGLHHPLRSDPIAVVGYGPSLAETWEQVKDYDTIITCSGAHKFLLERGVVPTYHLDVDPRPHKAQLIGTPHPDVEYLMASTCHKDVFDLLEGYNVKLWHIFDSEEEGLRILPPGEWSLTGGAGAGLRAMVVARVLGFTDLRVFGIDGSDGPTGKHAGAHPSQAKKRFAVDHGGVTYYTTPAFLECAKAVFHELDAMPDVTATFYGEGLVQAMARTYVRSAKAVQPNMAFQKPELISEELRGLNRRLHQDNLTFGVGGGKHAQVVKDLVEKLHTTSVLDYGCGKGYLARELPFPIWEYDPAIPGKDAAPRPADIVICTDVLEHVEDGKVQHVLGDLKRCLRQVGYFVIHLGPAAKTYADGRNTHLTQRGQTWWEGKVGKFFDVAKSIRKGPELHLVVGPLKGAGTAPLETTTFVTLPEPRLKFDGLTLRKKPYPYAGVQTILDPTLFQALASSFPSAVLFGEMGGGKTKLALGERTRPAEYAQHIAAHPAWQAFHAYVKSSTFLADVGTALASYSWVALPPDAELSARFEFSRLRSNGGCLLPHTDTADKLVTIVIGMRRDGDGWDDAWGGGTLMLKPKRGGKPADDYKAPLSDFLVVETMPYAPNVATIFVKTRNSWHAVGPLTGPGDGRMRRTVTINIERVKA